MEPHRLRAPKGDGAVFADPALSQAAGLLDANVAHLSRWTHDFQGRNAVRLRAMARAQILAKAREHHARFGLDFDPPKNPSAPWVATGHQPELFHPGVWVKNFAAAGIARERSGVSLNLIVDNDVPKSSAIRVPTIRGGRIAVESVDFDSLSGDVPYEDWTVASENIFATFAERVRAALGTIVPDPILDQHWPEAMRAAEATDRAGLRFSAARRSIEESWGISNIEVPLGAVCETEAFAWFASHILANLPRFQATHNAALARYRALYKIRSNNHPVPRLGREGDWLEAPFWVWRQDAPRRRPLLARQNAKTIDLRIGGDREPFASIRLHPDADACCAVEDLQDLPRRGIRLRTRALTTTMFARLLMGDLFIHGIGGAKYDELGDEVVRGFFGTGPPDYLTLSLTQWIGLEPHPRAALDLLSTGRELRDLRYNPDRFLESSTEPSVDALIQAKRAAVAGPVETRRQRVARFREIRHLNDALSAKLNGAFDAARDRLRAAEALAHDHARASSREWSFVLQSAERTREILLGIVPSAFLPKKNSVGSALG